jgi:lipopolysaccharide biosynthesis glycosyltransferase
MKKYVPVVLCFDKAYSDWACVAIYSAYLHTQSNLKFYCLVPNSDQGQCGSIELLREKYHLDLEIIYFDVNLFENWRIVGHFSRVIHSKFLIPELVDEAKVVYIDSDVLVLQPLEIIYEINLCDCPIAGVIDPNGAAFSPIPRHVDDIYINTGVMVMDLNSLRKDHFRKKCSDLYEAYKDSLKMPDQCIINKYAESRKCILDINWNVQLPANMITPDHWDAIQKDVSIMHFIFDVKPWMMWCNPLVFNFYWEYVKKLDIPDIKPIEITTMNQMISLANALDLNQSFAESSKLKTELINLLIKNLSEK